MTPGRRRAPVASNSRWGASDAKGKQEVAMPWRVVASEEEKSEEQVGEQERPVCVTARHTCWVSRAIGGEALQLKLYAHVWADCAVGAKRFRTP